MTDVKRIIPCLDVNDEGRVVKGVKFEGIKDVGDPVELARKYNAQGADELCFLDIGATYRNRATLLDVVRKVAAEITIPLCVAGGIRTVEDMREAVKAGAAKVSVCSAALARPELLSEMADAFGDQRVVLSIDAKRVSAPDEQPRWNAFSKGGRIDTGLDAVEWAVKAAEFGAGEIALNSIDTDGTGAGFDLELCSAISNAVSVPVAASSGAGSMAQIARVFKESSVSAAMVASMLHFGKTTVQEIKNYLESQGICVKR
jgi:cyclase